MNEVDEREDRAKGGEGGESGGRVEQRMVKGRGRRRRLRRILCTYHSVLA